MIILNLKHVLIFVMHYGKRKRLQMELKLSFYLKVYIIIHSIIYDIVFL